MKVERLSDKEWGYTIFMVKTAIFSTDIHHLMKHVDKSTSHIFEKIKSLNIALPNFVDLPDQTPWTTFWVKNGEDFRVTIGTDDKDFQKYIIVDLAIKGFYP